MDTGKMWETSQTECSESPELLLRSIRDVIGSGLSEKKKLNIIAVILLEPGNLQDTPFTDIDESPELLLDCIGDVIQSDLSEKKKLNIIGAILGHPAL